LTEYSDFRRNSLNNINLFIKEITGAQMSEREADRIRQAMPDPGEGLLDGDSSTQFESKWSSTMYSLRMIMARNIRLRKNGFDDQTIQKLAQTDSLPSISDMKSEINKRGNQLKKEGLSDQEIKAQIVKEFFTLEQ
jgi:hypothetical protein